MVYEEMPVVLTGRSFLVKITCNLKWACSKVGCFFFGFEPYPDCTTSLSSSLTWPSPPLLSVLCVH